jgi:perosamine synthetase
MRTVMDFELNRENPGCLSARQIEVVSRWLQDACHDPAVLCDLEGCGPVQRLEQAFARLCQRRFALALSSGTAAIHAALLGCGVGPGDEVIVTPYSWPQSVAPVLFCGAVPVFADIDAHTLNLDPAAVQARLSGRTKAIVPVHLFGHPADIQGLESVAQSAGVPLIFDAAHALGAKYGGHPVGAWGQAACFSFSRGKLLCAGEGGMLVTDNEALYARAMALTQHPERVRRNFGPGPAVDTMGLNYRLHPLAAVLALGAMDTMTERLAHRSAVYRRLSAPLQSVAKISTVAAVAQGRSACYGVPLIWNDAAAREEFTNLCQDKGWPLRCGPVGRPLHTQLLEINPAHPSHWPGACPIAEHHCNRRELWALSALDMDGLSVMEAGEMGRALAQLASL